MNDAAQTGLLCLFLGAAAGLFTLNALLWWADAQGELRFKYLNRDTRKWCIRHAVFNATAVLFCIALGGLLL